MASRTITASVETWPIAGEFVIARGAKTEAAVVVVEVSDGIIAGRGECVPYARYGETVENVREAILALGKVPDDRNELQQRMPAGAARNGVDCALWDFEAKRTGRRAPELAGLAPVEPCLTAFTIGLADPDEMAAKAAAAAIAMPLLKLKLGGEGDAERMRRARHACPGTRLIGDANESWTPQLLPGLMAVAEATGFELIEQPLPAGADSALADVRRTVPVCADESVHARASLRALAGRYDAVNIKLDKAGGLTEALALKAEARTAGFKIMVGCMVATSLAVAPAILLAQNADWVDLDGPLLLARDREPGLRYDGAMVHPASPQLWG
jgi:L-alanine-DL-glutamate epimerase-like enolase superfamily enzyme